MIQGLDFIGLFLWVGIPVIIIFLLLLLFVYLAALIVRHVFKDK